MQNVSAQSEFLTIQKRHTRVQAAISEKGQLVVKTLNENGIPLHELNILIAAYKYENEVDIFAKKRLIVVTQELQHIMSVKNLAS